MLSILKLKCIFYCVCNGDKSMGGKSEGNDIFWMDPSSVLHPISSQKKMNETVWGWMGMS